LVVFEPEGEETREAAAGAQGVEIPRREFARTSDMKATVAPLPTATFAAVVGSMTPL